MKQSTDLLKKALSARYDECETRAIIEWLFEEVCGLTRTQVLLYRDEKILPPEQSAFLARCAEQLEQGVPVQQVLGYEYFRGRRFEVNQHVLIPRPETAELVDMVVDKYVNKCVDEDDAKVATDVDKPVVKLVDIGTGSGCIALSLAADIHHSSVLSIDLSTEALKTAKHNAERLNISNVTFLQMDALQWDKYPLSTDLSTGVQPPFDAVVSNPPYICQKERKEMADHVLGHEPDMALFVPDDDPLLFYRAIGQFGRKYLKPGGMLYFEINRAYGVETCSLLERQGYRQVELIKDLMGNDRFVRAQNPETE